MEIFKQIAPLKAFLGTVRRQGKTIGLVPTMGALHAGHLSLIGASKEQNDITISSIYVNPTQFNNAIDLEKYPRILNTDTKLLQEVRCDALFCPDDQEMYPDKSVLKLDFGDLDKVMEGKFRPGHFSGVALIVSKLFNIIQPDNAYFGQKDWQQFAVISRLVDELKFGVSLHSVNTLRERDGLALSSRNLRLTPDQRSQAGVFYRALVEAREMLLRQQPIDAVKSRVKATVESERDVRLEYFELANSRNLKLLSNVSATDQPIMCIAGYVGEIRLIDNMFIHPNDNGNNS